MSKGKSSCCKYDLAEGKLKSFTRSSVRTKVMLCLIDGAKDTAMLEEAIGLRASTILHSIKDLMDNGLVERSSKAYALTNLGRIQSTVLNELVSSILTLDRHKDFWQAHDLSGIPIELLMRLGMLAESEIVSSDQSSPLRSHEKLLSEVRRSSEIYAALPVVIPGYPEAIADAMRAGASVDLILSYGAYDMAENGQVPGLKDILRKGGLRLHIAESEFRAAFTVTEYVLSLGLFRHSGAYDLGDDLICSGRAARDWGMELFDHHLSRSRPLRPGSLRPAEPADLMQLKNTLM